MPLAGYKQKRPDPDWWIEQIKAGEAYRKKWAYESSWDTWRKYYRGDWDRGVMPVNLYFTLLRSIVPRVYFRNPAISVVPGKPGMLNLAFARILERTDNKLIRRMKLKQIMKRVTQDAFMFGTGIPKVGFGGFYTPTPDPDGEDLIPFGEQGQMVEYNDFVQPNMPWFSRVHPGNFIVPQGLDDFEMARWVAEKVVRPVEDVREDPRFENTKGIRPNKIIETELGNIQRPEEMVELYEVRDRKTHSVFVIAPHKDGDKVIFSGEDSLQLYGGFPSKPVIFNEDDEHFWGIPDSKILEPYQLDINETRTMIMKHRRLTLVKLLVQRNKMSPEEAEKLVSEDVSAVAFVEGRPADAVDKITTSNIPPELFQMTEAIMQDVRETVGFSRNQFGEFNSRSGDTTATESLIVKQATEIRVDERRDVLADTLVSLVEQMHGIIFDHWTQENVVDVVGPGGVQVWVNFSGDLGREGRYQVSVDPDSSLPETRALREQRAVQMYQLLKTNPLVDPVKLTNYLLTELKGVQFDDMMKTLPSPDGGTPDRPISPADFAQMIGQSISQVGRPGSGNNNTVSQPTSADTSRQTPNAANQG